jgi:hypothetical protein
MITAERLREVLHYDQETGEFRWKVRRHGVRLGAVAGCIDARGYWSIKIDRRTYRASRLAWLYMTGEWPKLLIDHDNNVSSDNSWENLREASDAQNQWNSRKPRTNTSGAKGVTWRSDAGKWQAQICVNYRHVYLGLFDDISEAAAAYVAASEKYHGEFGRVA